MAIEPDTKNWTWVITSRCPDCGYDGTAVDRSRVGELTRANAEQWPQLLSEPDASVRPDEGTWSALEYGCHVRDVFALFDRRLRLMLDTVDPEFENWDQDETAVAERYDLQDPSTVAQDLVVAAEAMVATWDRVGNGDWERRGFRSDGSVFTVDSFARYFLHDPEHHLADVAAGYARLRA
jgi:hypothetical protein